MIFNPDRKVLNSILWCFLLFSPLVNGQTYRFKNFESESEIPNAFIYTLGQDKNGYLWVGTGRGIYKFDGFNFYDVPFPDSTSGQYPTSSVKDKNGTLWFGCDDGSVYYTEENNLKRLPVEISRAISDIIEGPDNSVWIVSQGEAIYRINSANPEEITSFTVSNDLVLYSASFTQTGNLLLGTQENIRIFGIEGTSLISLGTVEGFDYSSVTAIYKLRNKDSYIIGTNGNGLFRLTISEGNNILVRPGDVKELENLDVQSIFEDSDNNLWISTSDLGFLQIHFSEKDEKIESVRVYDQTSGLPGNNARLVFQDAEENLWFGMFGNGLSMLNSLAFSFVSPGTMPETNNIIYVTRTGSKYFLGTPVGFYLYDLETNRAEKFFDLRLEVGENEISSYCVDHENNIWIGTKGKGLYVKKFNGKTSQFYRSGNSGEDYITDIKTDSKLIWVGTLNGLIILERESGLVMERYNINEGLPHNSIDQIFITADGKAAVATKTDRLYLIDPETGVSSWQGVMSGITMNSILSFCQSSDGHIWAGTAGNGLFELYGDSLKSITRAEFLMSDYCKGVLADSVNRIWIGHSGGFSRYDRNTNSMRTFSTDFAMGGDCNPNGMYESSDGKVLIGTTRGLIVYDRYKDKKPRIAPFNNINSITINDISYPYRSSYTLPYSKRYIIKVNYVGISLSGPDKVYYQTKLDNWDNDWSEWTTDRVITASPRDGRYKFTMVSVNDDDLSDDPISFSLTIKKPFWRTLWFYLASIALLTGIVILIVRQREKAQKKIEQYLKNELDARTSEVMKQKDKIELQNIEITDSINYAKRIQTSILPDINKLKDTFKDAFIFYLPRDIVSGDFYWFDKFSDDKFILVCADSTGHGVPGAFMSMIGSTLLQDIVSRQRISRPSQILKLLDNQIFSTLNQNLELGVSNDGMDMIVCEINTKTRHVRFASAMRPVIIVLRGEPFYIKGNRSSIGGESTIEKFFDDQEYYLNEGDTIYLFSDGLPDQFGGPDGKKMKIARLKKLLEEVTKLPMSEQKDKISGFYDEWKGNYEQVDDILLIGARF